MPWKGHHEQEQDDALEGSPTGATTYGLIFSTDRDIDMEVRHGRPGARHGGALLSLPLPLLCWLVGRKTTARPALLLPPLLPSHHSATDAIASTEEIFGVPSSETFILAQFVQIFMYSTQSHMTAENGPSYMPVQELDSGSRLDPEYSQSIIGQFKSCLWKHWLTYWHNPDYNLVRFSFTLFTALLLGSILWKIGTIMGGCQYS
ncbi:hypothetical protein CFC21_067224 [Triticum aestivum]|uniref:ABC-2 type transporter transmembrane domain-containing protein n=2 Tax=Triticum aestivum TaxID=4565 RepID=A0A9R1H773_WHEAT|nr:hypothetical protein CFC21_067216 [Triticum aestivum]KAF7060436.1 hypothetical protein CFC21_067224 [Triticum aestivum]